MIYEEMRKLSDDMSRSKDCDDYLHDEITGAVEYLKTVDQSDYEDELMIIMVDFFRYGWFQKTKKCEHNEVKELTAAGALRKALLMYEGADLFLDEERKALSLDIMADYCVQALKALGKWEDDEDGGDQDDLV